MVGWRGWAEPCGPGLQGHHCSIDPQPVEFRRPGIQPGRPFGHAPALLLTSQGCKPPSTHPATDMLAPALMLQWFMMVESTTGRQFGLLLWFASLTGGQNATVSPE